MLGIAMSKEPSFETMLAAACCRWPPSQAGAVAVRHAASDNIDWHRFLHVVHRHRIEALVWAGLRHAALDVPEHVSTVLAGRAASIAIDNLRRAAEESRLFQAFEALGLELVFVKGTTAALLAYNSLAIKMAWDIDLLVSRVDVDRACALLASLGYERNTPDPALSGKEYRRWLNHSKEMLWINPALGTSVELHMALVDNPQLLHDVGMSSPRQIVRHGDVLALPTLATEELFSYMCVHGTIHFWARLKWLADVAAFIETNQLDCERLYRSSLELGAGRCGAVALLLCNRFFGTAVPQRLMAELRADRGVALLERSTFAVMALGETQAPDTESPWEVISLMAARFFTKPGLRHSIAEFRYRLFFPYSARHLAVWPTLWPILTLLQFPSFVLKRMLLRRGSPPLQAT
jgi:Uncharacterised nucleotidyltransferase